MKITDGLQGQIQDGGLYFAVKIFKFCNTNNIFVFQA